ncbi:MAG: phenylalanine--tRNA ligase subunit beta, partial [Bacteroidales bacterium]|nr:phenylalanine--tRNA ligase subunit beta [Bacteroidales bacterium]
SDFFHIKSATEMILSRIGLKPDELVYGESDKKYFAESITYHVNDHLAAETGRISKSYLSKLDINRDIYYSHIDWDLMLKLIGKNTISYTELPKFPFVRRDLALLLDKEIKFRQIRDIAFNTETNVLQEIGLFDVYESESLGKNKKSYAISFILRDDLKTLSEKSIDRVMNNLIRAFEKEAGARIR